MVHCSVSVFNKAFEKAIWLCSDFILMSDLVLINRGLVSPFSFEYIGVVYIIYAAYGR